MGPNTVERGSEVGVGKDAWKVYSPHKANTYNAVCKFCQGPGASRAFSFVRAKPVATPRSQC